MRRKILLGSGIAAAALYVGIDAMAALRYDGYSYTGQTISELSAVDAPTRSLWIPLASGYSVLTIACGAGIWAAAGQQRKLKVVASLVAGLGTVGLVAWPFAPMHQREVLAAGGGTLTDTMHIVLATVDSFLFILAIVSGATAFGRSFRLYSFATISFVLVSGALTGLEGGKVGNNEPTPWIGVTERIAVFGSMLWIAVLAGGLLFADRATASRPQAKARVAPTMQLGDHGNLPA
jgi:hypothetical protein